MTPQENLLINAQEECNEVAQRISKAIRFGLEERQPGQDKTNRERIVEEFSQLCAKLCLALGVFRNLGIADIACILDLREFLATPAKVEKFAAYSVECGTLSMDPETFAKKVAQAYSDPGHFTTRVEINGYYESLGEWQARALQIAKRNFPLTGSLNGETFLPPVKEFKGRTNL